MLFAVLEMPRIFDELNSTALYVDENWKIMTNDDDEHTQHIKRIEIPFQTLHHFGQ